MMRLLLGLLALTLVTPALAAEALGKLFFTPAERAQLDQARSQKQRPAPKAEEPTAAAPPAPQVLTYNGIVRRSDGKAVLWLNNRPVDEKDVRSGYSVSGQIRTDGGMTLRAQTGRTFDLKVGQTVELNSGTVGESAARGAPTPPTAVAKPEPEKTIRDAPPRDAADTERSERTAPSPTPTPAPAEPAPRPR